MKSKSRSKGRKGKKSSKKKHRSKKGSKKRHNHKTKKPKSSKTDCTTTPNVTTTDDECGQPNPKFISKALAFDNCDDLAKSAFKPETFNQNKLYSKYKFSSSDKAEVALNRTFHEAAANITQQFYGNYIPKLEACNCGDIKALLQNCPEPSALQETLRNGFQAYLTSTGHYEVLKRRLQTAINDVIQQRFQPPSSGSGDDKGHQFAQDLYVYLTDRLQEALVESQFAEGSPVAASGGSSDDTYSVLHGFAEEAQIFGDSEVAQRLHLRRICEAPEDPQPWIDHSIFWSSSVCDYDQLAEVAVREALALDPQNVVALVLLGIIAARNRDPRAVPLIGQAVKLRPLAPELVVVLATAYKMLGLDLEAQYFYLKARYIMLKLTGQDTKPIEVALDRVYQLQPAKPKHKKKSGKHKEKESSRSQKKKKSIESPKRKKKSKKSEKKAKKSPVTQILEDQADLVSNGSKAKGEVQVPIHVSCYDVPIEVGEESLQSLMDVGPLPRSLWITWDVTRPYGVREEGAEVQPSGWESERCQKRGEEIFGSTMALASAQLSKTEVVKEQIEFYAYLKGQEEALDASEEKKAISSKSRSRKKKSKSPKKKSKSQKKKSKSPKEKSKSRHKKSNSKTGQKMSKSAELDTEVHQSQYALLQRYGSEYIWAAQLLLHLKAFDFLDLVLAKELYLTQAPSVPFLYLVSTSMMIRSHCKVAQKLLEKVLKVPEMSQNPHILALHGLALLELCDCCGARVNLINAIQHAGSNSNFLLAHLKLANLYANLGEYEVSKSLFLKTVSQHPSLYSWILLGDVCYRHEEFKNAEIAYSQANKLDNTNPTIWGMLSLISMVQENRVLAEQAFKWAVRFGLDPNGRIMEALRVLQELKGYGDPFVVTPKTAQPPISRRFEDYQKTRVVIPKCESVEDQQLRYQLMMRIKGSNPVEQ